MQAKDRQPEGVRGTRAGRKEEEDIMNPETRVPGRHGVWATVLVGLLAAPLVEAGPPEVAPSHVEVRMEAGRVTIRAADAPLAAVIARLQEATGVRVSLLPEGMSERRVTSEGGPRPVEQALVAFLRGAGWDFAVASTRDRDGRLVELRVVVAEASSPGAPASAPQEAQAARQPAEIPAAPAQPTETAAATAEKTQAPTLGRPPAALPPDVLAARAEELQRMNSPEERARREAARQRDQEARSIRRLFEKGWMEASPDEVNRRK